MNTGESLSKKQAKGAKIIGTDDAQTSTAPDRNERPLPEVPILAKPDSTPIDPIGEVLNNSPWSVGDRRGDYDCFLAYSSNALGLLDDILERHAGEQWANPLIVELAEVREDLDRSINHGVRLHNCILAWEHNSRVATDKAVR